MAMTAIERKAALGYGTATKIAKRTRRSLGHVSQVISGTRRDAKVEAEVAARIGKPVDEVFASKDAVESVGAAVGEVA